MKTITKFETLDKKIFLDQESAKDHEQEILDKIKKLPDEVKLDALSFSKYLLILASARLMLDNKEPIILSEQDKINKKSIYDNQLFETVSLFLLSQSFYLIKDPNSKKIMLDLKDFKNESDTISHKFFIDAIIKEFDLK